MALKLGELLISRKMFTRRQLEEALEAQAVFGGRLGTILIEMGAIGELDLAQVLSNQLGVPFAHPDQLVDIPADALNALTPELAQKYQVLPIRLEKRILTVVMANPRDLKAIDELGIRSGYVIRPILAPELRLNYALEHYYQLPRKTREYVPHQAVSKELERLKRGGADAAAPITAPRQTSPEHFFSDLGVDLSDMGSEPVLTRMAKSIAAAGDKQLNREHLKVPRENSRGRPLLLKIIVRQLSEARHHDDVAEALLLYLGESYARVALFKVAGEQAIGWCSAHNGLPIPGFDNSHFSLGEASVLQTAVINKQHYSGPLGIDGADRALLKFFGNPTPVSSLILPLIMHGRVVSLIYIDDPQLNPAKAVSDLQQLADKALLSFEMLTFKKKILRL